MPSSNPIREFRASPVRAETAFETMEPRNGIDFFGGPEETEHETIAGEAVEAGIKEPERAAGEISSAYNLYLREIVQTKLLTPAEEVALAARIRRGDEAAREQMIKANLRLVVRIAREYENHGVPLLDLINEGNLGLMKAVERFDPRKGAKLATYAAWWIKQGIRRALSNQSKTIRLPVHVGDSLAQLRRASLKLEETLGREPTDQELARALGTSASRVANLRRVGRRPSALEAPISSQEDSAAFADIIGDEKAETPAKEFEEKTNTVMIRELVAELPPRETMILRHRFGLDGQEPKTLEQVGRMFGLTRERIRQLQVIALNRLRRIIRRREVNTIPA